MGPVSNRAKIRPCRGAAFMTDKILPVFAGSLEIRRVGGGRTLSGRFPYNSTATVRDRGRVRKESFNSGAFKYSVEQETDRPLDLLSGHEFSKPLASRQSGTLKVRDTESGLIFEAELPDDPPSWVIDTERAIDAGLMTGVSPGFSVPPRSVVPNAEILIPEPGNRDVEVRVINHAVLREISIVSAPVYRESTVELRQEDIDAALSAMNRPDGRKRGRRLWL